MKIKNSKLYFMILLITLIFLVPIIVAKILLTENIKLGHTNKGDLITPPIAISSVISSKNELNHTWKIAYLSPGICQKACQQKLYQLRKLQIALAKNMNRVQPVLLAYQPQRSINQNIKQIILNKKIFVTKLQKYTLNKGMIFIIDPMGNLMMSYRATTSMTPIFKDIQHLVKASKIG